MADLIFKDETYKIIGAAMEVYNEMGHGFVEPMCQEAFCYEMSDRNIPFLFQPPVKVHYKHRILKKEYGPDYIAYEQILIETKVMEKLTSREDSQVIYYLNATRLPLGLLINFGNPYQLEWKRLVNTGRP